MAHLSKSVIPISLPLCMWLSLHYPFLVRWRPFTVYFFQYFQTWVLELWLTVKYMSGNVFGNSQINNRLQRFLFILFDVISWSSLLKCYLGEKNKLLYLLPNFSQPVRHNVLYPAFKIFVDHYVQCEITCGNIFCITHTHKCKHHIWNF